MKALNTKSHTHKIHTDIQPILSAIKHGNKRIANLRYQSLCEKLNLMKWESVIVSDIIRNKCSQRNIAFN
jgi:hypothetical protein